MIKRYTIINLREVSYPVKRKKDCAFGGGRVLFLCKGA